MIHSVKGLSKIYVNAIYIVAFNRVGEYEVKLGKQLRDTTSILPKLALIVDSVQKIMIAKTVFTKEMYNCTSMEIVASTIAQLTMAVQFSKRKLNI